MVYLKMTSSLGSLEAAHLKLGRLQRKHETVDLWLSQHLRAKAFGGRAALMQFISTWADANRSHGRIRTYLDSHATVDQLTESLRSLDHLFYAAFAGVPIIASDGMTDISARIESAALIVLRERAAKSPPKDDEAAWLAWRSRRKVEFEKELIARSVFVLIADDFDRLVPEWLYDHGSVDQGFIEDSDFTDEIASSIFDLRRHRRRAKVPARHLSSLNWTVYELFKNTHQWARRRPTDLQYQEEAVQHSTRAIYARYQSIDRRRVNQYAGDNLHFVAFVENSSSEDRVNLLEVSIVDTGFGVANRRAHEQHGLRTYSLGEQVTSLRWALARQRTESDNPLKGIGFHRAFTELNELGGFIQIRTGNLFAVRDFNAMPYPSDAESASTEVDGLDQGWTDIRDGLGVGDKEFAVPASPVVGTRISMFFPLPPDFFEGGQ